MKSGLNPGDTEHKIEEKIVFFVKETSFSKFAPFFLLKTISHSICWLRKHGASNSLFRDSIWEVCRNYRM